MCATKKHREICRFPRGSRTWAEPELNRRHKELYFPPPDRRAGILGNQISYHLAPERAYLEGKECGQVGRGGHVGEHEGGPFPVTGFFLDDGEGGEAWHAEDGEDYVGDGA
jgi:hypothetical protein